MHVRSTAPSSGVLRRRRRAAAVAPFLVAGLLASACSTETSNGNPIEALPVEQSVAMSGLGAPVDVVFDDNGAVHLYGKDPRSVLFAQGYVTASQRFFMMDALRRYATGRLSELFGTLTLSTDVQMRTMFTTRDGRRLQDALWERLSAEDPEAASYVSAYAAGINAWLDDLRAGRSGAQLPPEYGFALIGLGAADLAPWDPRDTLALGRLQAYNLANSLSSEISLARTLATLPDDLARDVYRFAPATNATVLPPAENGARPESVASAPSAGVAPAPVPAATMDAVLRSLEEAERWNPMGSELSGVGSNNWIVSPELSESGFAMMANDPHLQLFNPPIWHMVQLSSSGDGPGSPGYLNANGVIFPGLPGIILGSNDRGAWGATVSVFDVTDVYQETVTTPSDYPASPRTVSFRGRQVPVIRLEEKFRVNRGETVTRVVEVVPHHGPMVPDPDPADDVDGLAATGLTVRWTGHEITLDSRFLIDLQKARNVGEFRAALRNFAVGGQNWVWADVDGNIAYFPYVLVPQRPAGTVPYLPMPGTGEAEWLVDGNGDTAWLPADRIPQATNPPQGFLATSNNDQVGNTLDNDPLNDAVYLAPSYDLGFRQQRILEMLDGTAGLRAPGARMSAADLSRYQFDTQSKEAERLLPHLFAAADARPELVTPAMSDALARLREWGRSKPGTAPGAVAWDMVSGIDVADVRDDATPRTAPVSDEERADAVASSIFAGFSSRLARLVLADEYEGTGLNVPGGAEPTKALLHVLEDVNRPEPGRRVHTLGPNGESRLWDDRRTPEVETRDEVLLRALADGLAFLSGKFESQPTSGWLWGKIHPARFQHFFGQGGLPTFDLFPFAAPGGRFTVNPANWSFTSDTWSFAGGPSMRHVAILDPKGIRAVNQLPGGNNGNPGGRDAENYNRIAPEVDYATHVPGWIGGEVFEVRLTPGDVASHASRRLRYVP
ncbi:MAG: penicillin acylase family protein [Alphaproteobacteria bacterium]